MVKGISPRSSWIFNGLPGRVGMFQLRRGLAVIGMTLGLGAALTGCSSGSASNPAPRHAHVPYGYASSAGHAEIPVVTVNTVRGSLGYARGAGAARAVPARRASGGC